MNDLPYRNFMRMTGLVVLIFCLLLAVYAISQTFLQRGKLPVTINLVPSDARLTLNGQVVRPGKTHLEPGGYKVEATKDGFAPFESTVEIRSNSQTIAVPLTPTSDDAKKWAKDNQEAYAKLEAEAGQAAIQEGVSFRKTNPITSRLPYRTMFYTIGYRADPADPSGQRIIIEVDAPEGYRQAAVYQLQQWGYEPGDYTINFKGFVNPF